MMPTEPSVLHTFNGEATHDGEIDALVAALRAEPAHRPLLIWFHGGLVTTAAGEATAERIGPFLAGKGHFPVFLVWESGIGPSLRDAVAALVKRKLGAGVIRLISGLVHVKKGDQALGIDRQESHFELTDVDRRILEEAVEKGPEFREEATLLGGGTPFAVAAIREDADKATATDEDLEMQAYLQVKLPEVAGRPGMGIAGLAWLPLLKTFVVDVAMAVLERFRKGRDHGIVQTIVEEAARKLEIGKDIWDAMKSDAEANFAPGGGGRQLLIRLRDEGLLSGRPIVLAGHSTGAVLMHYALKAADEEKIDAPFHLRYLAPACRCDLAATTLNETRGRIASVRVFAMDERYEHAENLLDGVPGFAGNALLEGIYKGSLLYFVSGALEAESDAPIFGMQRFIRPATSFLTSSEASSVRTIVETIEGMDENAFVWTRTGAGGKSGYQGQSITHGGFDDALEMEPNGAISSLLLTVDPPKA